MSRDAREYAASKRPGDARDMAVIATLDVGVPAHGRRFSELWTRDSGAVVTALSELVKSRDDATRRRATLMLGFASARIQYEEEQSRRPLLEFVTHAILLLAGDNDATVRQRALGTAIGLLRQSMPSAEEGSLVRALVRAMDDQEEEVRRTAVVALARTGHRELIPDELAAKYARHLAAVE